MRFHKKIFKTVGITRLLFVITGAVLVLNGCTNKRVYSSVFYANIDDNSDKCERFILSLKGLGKDSLEAIISYKAGLFHNAGNFQFEILKRDSTNYYSAASNEKHELYLKYAEGNNTRDSIGIRRMRSYDSNDSLLDVQFNRPTSDELLNYFAIEELHVLRVIDKRHYLVQWRTVNGKEYKDVFEGH